MPDRANTTLSDTASVAEVVAAAPGLMCLLDEQGRCAAVSVELAALLGISVRELVGRPWAELIGDATAAVGGEGAPAPMRVRHPDGTERWLELSSVPVAGGARLCAVRDVTAERRVREADLAIQRWEARLLASERLAVLGSLAGGIAHQINDALTSTRLSLGRLISFELAQTPITPVRQHRIELLQDAREGVARVEHITRELRTFSQSESDPSVTGPVELRAIVDSAVNLAAHELRHCARLELDLRALPPVRGGEQALRQVFLNLLINAIQAMPEGSADCNTIRVSSTTDELGNAVVEIADTGKGIAPQDLGRIFEPFFTTKPSGEGLGLGLSVCHDIVNGLGGRISAESAPGRGTVVRVVLPPAPQAEASVAKPRAQTASERRRILIVDDDRPVAAAIALELEDHDVVVAGSGREAFEILRRDPAFDVILCDVMMPELSGVDLYNWLRPIEPQLLERFVFMTGGAFTARAEQFLRDIPNARLDKPFHPDDLRRVIASVPPAIRSDPSISIRTRASFDGTGNDRATH